MTAVNTANRIVGSFVPLNAAAGRKEPCAPLVCVCQRLSVECASGQFDIESIFISPSGRVVIVLLEPLFGQELSDVAAELRTWDYDILDDTAEEYSYGETGQAYRIIDIMARHGHLDFSDAGRLARSINQCMRSGNFILLGPSPESDL